MNDPVVIFAAVVMDAIWWPVMIGVPVFAAIMLAAGIVHMHVIHLMFTSHLRMPPPPPPRFGAL